jgi:hypothetical protein
MFLFYELLSFPKLNLSPCLGSTKWLSTLYMVVSSIKRNMLYRTLLLVWSTCLIYPFMLNTSIGSPMSYLELNNANVFILYCLLVLNYAIL